MWFVEVFAGHHYYAKSFQLHNFLRSHILGFRWNILPATSKIQIFEGDSENSVITGTGKVQCE